MALRSRPAITRGVLVLCVGAWWTIAPAAFGQVPVRSRARAQTAEAVRSIDGVVPDRIQSHWGAAGTQLLRWTTPAYQDGMSAPTGEDRAGARQVSNIVNREDRAIANPVGASSFLWQWGQFLDHDIDLTDAGTEELPIPVPVSDPFFNPTGSDRAVINFFRSAYDPLTGRIPGSPRQQLNFITSCIDASNVYGSDAVRATALRTMDGTGRLRMSPRGLLPMNTQGFPNAGGDSPDLFLGGDVRANEQIGLTSLHVVFVREHNRLAAMVRATRPGWSGERIYQRARALVGAEMQAITYREFLPILLGPDALSPYEGYREDVDPGIANIFSSAAYRVGHTMLNEQLLRLQPDGRTVPEGVLPLAQAFFRPSILREPGALEALLRGLAAQQARAVDPYLTDAVRNFLFGAPGRGGFDLAALNIQRGRDHGLPDYNTAREQMGLARKTSFAAVSSDPEIQDRLEEAYGSVDDIDPWVGGLAEDRVGGGLLGEFFAAVATRQFQNLRDGDPFWYERSLNPQTRAYVESLTLGAVIRLNTEIGEELPLDVFRAPSRAPF